MLAYIPYMDPMGKLYLFDDIEKHFENGSPLNGVLPWPHAREALRSSNQKTYAL